MAKNGIQTGDILTLDPGATVSSGDLIAVGTDPELVIGVALTDGVNGTKMAVGVKGVYDIEKTTGTAWAVGDAIYMDGSTSKGTRDADGSPLVGYCVEAAASGATTGKVLFGVSAGAEWAPRIIASGQIAFTASATGTASVGAAYDGKVVRFAAQTNDGSEALIKGAVASGTLTITASGSMTGKVYYEILDVDVA